MKWRVCILYNIFIPRISDRLFFLVVAVCGFEAFINGEHIVGKVREKEQAHKEYREAIQAGHGAYLLDEGTI